MLTFNHRVSNSLPRLNLRKRSNEPRRQLVDYPQIDQSVCSRKVFPEEMHPTTVLDVTANAISILRRSEGGARATHALARDTETATHRQRKGKGAGRLSELNFTYNKKKCGFSMHLCEKCFDLSILGRQNKCRF